MKRPRLLGAAVASAAMLSALAAHPEPKLVPATSLHGRFGLKPAEALLVSPSKEDRIRGLERLGGSTSHRAVARLASMLEPGGGASTAEERLTAVRALAGHEDTPDARRALVRVLGGHVAQLSAETRTRIDELARGTAAMSLARSGKPDALSALGRALDASGAAADAAASGLVAYPPHDLSPLLSAARSASLDVVAALDALGDQRAFARLRELVRIGSPEVRAHAALALTRLGDFETVELARRWLVAGQPSPLRIAAATILATAHDPGASAAIIALLEDAGELDAGLELAARAPTPDLVPVLSRLLESTEGARAASIIRDLGVAGGPLSIKVLEANLAHPARGSLAADALARAPGDGPRRALERALHIRSTMRLAALGGTLRFLVQGDTLTGFHDVLARLVRSKDPEDRAAGASGLAALDPNRIDAFVTASDAAVARAAAGLLLLAPGRAAEHAVERLAREHDPSTREALAIALAVPSAERAAPRSMLMALVDEAGAAAALAARALAARDESDQRFEVDALLRHPDPRIRAEAALGLGRSGQADATGRLEQAYAFEPEPDVRAAIVRALSIRSDEARSRTLELADTLDPSEAVRALARRAIAGARLPEATTGRAALLVDAAQLGAHDPRNATLVIDVSGGLSLPGSGGPGGLTIVAGLPEGLATVRVAPDEKADNDPARGDSGNPKSDRIDRSQQEP